MSLQIAERLLIILALLIAILPVYAEAQVRSLGRLPDFIQHTDENGLTISREVVDGKPFSVVGPRGAVLGNQNGIYEAWIFPWKIFSGMRMTVNMDNYPVPIDVNKQAAWIPCELYDRADHARAKAGVRWHGCSCLLQNSGGSAADLDLQL
jgi:hypothetical protein